MHDFITLLQWEWHQLADYFTIHVDRRSRILDNEVWQTVRVLIASWNAIVNVVHLVTFSAYNTKVTVVCVCLYAEFTFHVKCKNIKSKAL